MDWWSGHPLLDRTLMAEELALLPGWHPAQRMAGTLERPALSGSAPPVRSGVWRLGLANPLEAEGIATSGRLNWCSAPSWHRPVRRSGELFAALPAAASFFQWELTLWTYEAPHVGASARRLRWRPALPCLHAPQGDTYADLLFTMIERRGNRRPPVNPTPRSGRDLGGTLPSCDALDPAAVERFRPGPLVGESCNGGTDKNSKTGTGASRRAAWGLGLAVVNLGAPYSNKRKIGGG